MRFLPEHDRDCFCKFNSPVGILYIIGKEEFLKSIILKNKTGSEINYLKNIPEKETQAITQCLTYLTNYFSGGAQYILVKSKCGNQILSIFYKNKKSESLELNLNVYGYTAKEISVYQNLLDVGFGRTVSYDYLAEKSGVHGGARFIGNAMAGNRFPIIIPCHRVIRKNGRPGKYSSGPEVKKYLLRMEGSSWKN